MVKQILPTIQHSKNLKENEEIMHVDVHVKDLRVNSLVFFDNLVKSEKSAHPCRLTVLS